MTVCCWAARSRPRLMLQFRTMPEPQLDEHATCAAEFCWLTVAPAADISSERMFKADLAVLLQNDQEAEFAFSLFDLDGDGYVTEPEVHSRIQSMYRSADCPLPLPLAPHCHRSCSAVYACCYSAAQRFAVSYRSSLLLFY